MPISQYTCAVLLEEEIKLYYSTVFGSLALTAANVLLYAVCFKRSFQGAPGLASQFFFTTGSVKVVMGLLIYVLFQPHCPEGCSRKVCVRADIPSPLYAFICSLVGFLWIYKGYQFLVRANQLENGQSQGAKDNMFTSLPQSETTEGIIDEEQEDEVDRALDSQWEEEEEKYVKEIEVV